MSLLSGSEAMTQNGRLALCADESRPRPMLWKEDIPGEGGLWQHLLFSRQAQSQRQLGSQELSHLPPRITIFFCVSSPMNDLTRLKATGKSLGAETHRTPLGSWTTDNCST